MPVTGDAVVEIALRLQLCFAKEEHSSSVNLVSQ